MEEHPESVYCLPVRVTPPWNADKELRIREMVQMCATSREFHELCTCRGYRSLYEMLNCFEVFLPIVRGNLELIEQLAFDFCQRQWEQKVVYTEVRYSPHLLAEGFASSSDVDDDKPLSSDQKITPTAVLDAVTRGLRRGYATFDHLTINQILCCIAWRPEWAMSTLEMASLRLDDFPCAVVGVDIAAGEEHFNSNDYPELFRPHFAMAKEAEKRRIPLTLHAGEATENALENVRRAIVDYGARRIGHGYRMTECETTMALVRDRNIHVEVCLTSSDETGGWVYQNEGKGGRDWKKHPAVTMRENGVSISLSSDDPAVFHTSLAWQYRLTLAKMELTQNDVIQMNLAAIEAAWCSNEEKSRLKALILSFEESNNGKEYGHADSSVATNARRIWARSKTNSFQDRVYISESERL